MVLVHDETESVLDTLFPVTDNLRPSTLFPILDLFYYDASKRVREQAIEGAGAGNTSARINHHPTTTTTAASKIEKPPVNIFLSPSYTVTVITSTCNCFWGGHSLGNAPEQVPPLII